MNYTNIIKQILPNREISLDIHSLIPTLFAVLVVIFFGLMVYFTITAPEVAIVTEAEVASVKANPELSTFQRYARALDLQKSASFLKVNPEVGVYQRYMSHIADEAERSFLATNPEIMSVRRYAPGDEVALAKAKVLATNPELIIYQRYKEAAEERFLAENPEINAYQRYIVDQP